MSEEEELAARRKIVSDRYDSSGAVDARPEPAAMTFEIGEQVIHSTHGAGVVTESTWKVIIVDFGDSVGTKTFSARVAHLYFTRA